MEHEAAVEVGVGERLLDGAEKVELELGHVSLGIEPVAGADGYGETVDARLGDEPHGLVGLGVVDDLVKGLVHLGGADVAELALDGDVANALRGDVVPLVAVGDLGTARVAVIGAGHVRDGGMGGLDDLLARGDVLLEGEPRGVDHHGGEAGANGDHDVGEGGAVVEVDHDGHRGALCTPDHARDDVGSDVLELVGVNLDDHRRGLLLRDVDDAVEHRVVADVERGHRKVSPLRDAEQFPHVDKHAHSPILC